MEQKLSNAIAFLLCLGAVLLLAHPSATAKQPLSSVTRCSNDIRVKIGNHLFTTPGSFGVMLDDGKGATASCDGSIVEASIIYYFPSAFLGKPGETETDREKVQIEFGVGALSGRKAKSDVYTKYKLATKLAKAGVVDIKHLPLEDGFYKFSYQDSYYFFIAAGEDLQTPLGNPVTFVCTKIHPSRKPLKCGTGTYWKDGLTVWMDDFPMTHLPTTEWRQFYGRFLAFMDEIETPSTK